MHKSLFIAPSILSADFSDLQGQLRTATSGGMDWVHVDVMDGHFVPNISMGPMIVATLRRLTPLPLDIHLMIDNPDQHLMAFKEAGANNLTVHIEGNQNIHRTLQNIRNIGCHPGIALNPGTPVSALDAILDEIDLVLVMTVNPGFSGQEFIPSAAKKIKLIAEKIQSINKEIWLEVDGGISADTAGMVFSYGANVLVAGNSIFKNPEGIEAAIRSIRKAV